ncbi:MAG: tandem-95 repeat protein, partial [Candidatus Stygibacter australis]|nr:tandem-95 repeat protein [Candidatus Stygibacter australis]
VMVALTVIPVNDMPYQTGDLVDIHLLEDFEPYQLDLTGYFGDVEEDELIYEYTFTPEEIVLVFDQSAMIEIQSVENWNGESWVGVAVSDGEYTIDTSFTVYVESINDEPVAEANGPYYSQADEEGNAEVMLDGSGSYDIDGEIVAWDWSWEGGSVSGEMPMAVFATGVFEVMLTVTDDEGGFGTDLATVTVSGYENMAPVAEADSFEGEEDTSISGNVLYNDIDPDEYPEAMTADLITDVSWGALALSANGDFTYMPNENWNGDDSFEYRAFDGIDYSEPVMVALTVISVNDIPYQTGDLVDIYLMEDFEPYQLDLTGYFGDVEEDELIYEYTFTPEEIVIVFDQSAMIEIQSVENWNGESWVGVAVSDGEYTIDTSFMVYVESVNDDPVIELPDSFTMDEAVPFEVDFAEFTSDFDEDVLELTVSGNEYINVLIEGLNVTFDSPSWYGEELLTFTINDNMGRAIDTDDVLLIVRPALFEAEITVGSATVLEDELFTISVSTTELYDYWNVISFEFDINYDAESYEYVGYEAGNVPNPNAMLLVNNSAPGVLAVAYADAIVMSGIGDLVIFEFMAVNAGLSEINAVDFHYNSTEIFNVIQGMVEVIDVNHPPVADAGMDQSPYELEPVMLDGTASYDPDGQDLDYEWIVPDGIELDDPMSATPGFIAPEVIADEEFVFTLNVSDGEYTDSDEVIITVLNINHPPVADAGEDQIVEEGNFVQLDGSGSFDPDGIVFRDVPDWMINPPDYEYSGFIWGMLMLNDVPGDDVNDMIGVFVGDECRGIAQQSDNSVQDYTEPFGHIAFMPQVFSNVTSGETLTFKLYDASAGMIYDIDETLDFVADMTVGDGNDPFIFTVNEEQPTGLEYSWIVPAGIFLENADGPNPTFIAPAVNEDTDFVITLEVSDGEYTDTDEVMITVMDAEIPEIIAEITVTSGVAEPGESVNIDVLTTYIDPLWSVFSYEFWLEYNDAELSLDGWSLDGTIVNPDGELEVIFERGVVNIKFVSQVSSGGREYIPIEGAGSLINLEFTSLTGGQSPLEVYDFTFNSVEVGVINQGVINNNGPTVLIPIPLQTVFEDFGSFTLDLDGYFIDLDEGDELTYINIESGDGIEWGLLDNVLTINSVDNFNGTIPMSVTAWDGYTDSLTVTSEFDIVVTPVNDVPVIDLPEMYSFAEDGELIVDFAPFISDVDGDGLTLSVTGNENITAVITGTMVTFGALENYFGNETLTFAVDDGVDRVTATDDILIEVTSVNDLPVADAGVPINAMAGPEGIALITLNGSGSYDVDGEIIEHYWSWDGGEAYGENPQIELALGNYTISLLVTD